MDPNSNGAPSLPPNVLVAELLRQLVGPTNTEAGNTPAYTTAESAFTQAVPVHTTIGASETTQHSSNNPIEAFRELLRAAPSSIAPPPASVPISNVQAPKGSVDYLQQLQSITATAKTQDPRPRREVKPVGTTTSTASSNGPSAILEWPAALRWVNQLGQRGQDLHNAVRRMIEEQQGHERQWWSERQKLEAEIQRTSGNAFELSVYDAKVYKAQLEMNNDMAKRLKTLGVPFFGISPDLVIVDREPPVEVKGKITASRLRELQQKMVEYLQDMYAP